MDRLLSLKNPLKAHRIKVDSSVEAIAQEVGVSRETWRRWEIGDDLPTDRNLVKLSDHLDMEPADILAKLTEFRKLKAEAEG